MVISIPFKALGHELIVKTGQDVDFETPLFKKKLEGEVVIPLAAKIKIAPKHIYLHLKKVIGDRIKKGELIAEKKGFMSTTQYFSEYDGVIKEIDHNQGYLLIGVSSQEEEVVSAFFRGKIISVNDDTVEIQLGKGHEFPLKTVSSSFGGEVIHLDTDSIAKINEKTAGLKVAIMIKLLSHEQSKLEALGIDGFITIDALPNNSSIPFAHLKDPADLEKIKAVKLPYCIIDRNQSIIYFYE